VTIDANSKATITWSDALNGAARAVGSTVTLPSGLLVPNSTLVWGETFYSYTPTIGYVISGTMTLSDQVYMAPRISSTIARTAT
jgi:hypothetical protein